MKRKVLLIAGARPNFMKVAPVLKEMRKNRRRFDVKLVHTGQHYDYEMSDIFFKNLNIPKPDICLDTGSASHASQTAAIMTAFEKTLIREKPDMVIVVGDVNSTLACALTAVKMDIQVAHVEAGLRSFDDRMPEEINRKLTDSISNYLFVTEESGLKNLKNENIDKAKIYFVGNVMIDTLLSNMGKIDRSGILKDLRLKSKDYCVMTIHRPANVDTKRSLRDIYGILEMITRKVKIVYPVHPRAKKMMRVHGLTGKFRKLDGLCMVDPLGYADFIKLVKGSAFVITDSGGIQEEATVLKVPCLTIRDNTERPVTIKAGANHLVGRDMKKIARGVDSILNGKIKKIRRPAKWDGRAAKRIVKILGSI